MRYQLVIGIIIILFTIGCMGPLSKKPPAHGRIEEKYYVCEESKTLIGGIFGKGPIKKFGENKNCCFRDQWKDINKETFKALAEGWYGHDWDKDIPFWQD